MSHSNNVPPGGNEHLAVEESSSSTLNQIQLRWTSHQPTIFSIFQKLYNSENLVDVTLAAEGKYLRAHKIILSACSPYFQELLSVDCSTKHPILFMGPEVKFKELKAVLNYMYKGETHIHQGDLPSLLRLAESLQIRGLAETDDTDTDSRNVPPPPVPDSQQRVFADPLHCPSPTDPQPPQHILISNPISQQTISNLMNRTSAEQLSRQQQPLPARSSNTSSPSAGKHKLSSTCSIFSKQPQLINDPIPFPSMPNPIDVSISTSHSFKRLRRDPSPAQMSTSSPNIIQPILISDQLQHHNVMVETPPPRHPITTLSFGATHGFNDGHDLRDVNVTQPPDGGNSTQFEEMEHVEIINQEEIKVEDDGLGSADIGLIDESNSSHLVGGGDQSVGDEFEDDGEGDEQNNWNMFENVEGGGHSEFGVPFPSTSSSSIQAASDRGPEVKFTKGTKPKSSFWKEFEPVESICGGKTTIKQRCHRCSSIISSRADRLKKHYWKCLTFSSKF